MTKNYCGVGIHTDFFGRIVILIPEEANKRSVFLLELYVQKGALNVCNEGVFRKAKTNEELY